MNKFILTFALAAVAAVSAVPQASAGSPEGGRRHGGGGINFVSVIEYGSASQSVTINQIGNINIANVVQIAGPGPSQTVVMQSGFRNIAEILQIGASNASAVWQSGFENLSRVRQFDDVGSAKAAALEERGMNGGHVHQFGDHGKMRAMGF